MRASLALFALPLGLACAALTGCYTVDFDENAADVYYCTVPSDCSSSQACSGFTCVDNTGPAVEISAPELLQNLEFGALELTVNYSTTDFVVSDSNARVEGEGKMLVSILGTDLSTTSVVSQGAQIDIDTLAPGAYRLSIQAVYGDGEAYSNPSASDYTVFYIEDTNATRPQAAIISPVFGQTHPVGEALDVEVAARNFEFIGSGEDCRVDAGCDPWADGADCLPADCEVVGTGHAHVYVLSDYPSCLNNDITCNGDYVLSLRPSDNVASDGTIATATIPADRFTEPGTLTFSIGLQYNDHEPYPNADFIIHDQITIEVVE